MGYEFVEEEHHYGYDTYYWYDTPSPHAIREEAQSSAGITTKEVEEVVAGGAERQDNSTSCKDDIHPTPSPLGSLIIYLVGFLIGFHHFIMKQFQLAIDVLLVVLNGQIAAAQMIESIFNFYNKDMYNP